MTRRTKAGRAKRKQSGDLRKLLESLATHDATESAEAAPSEASPPSPSRTFRVEEMEPGSTQEGMLAKMAIRPTLRAANTVATFDRSCGELDLTTLVGKLADQVTAVQGGDLGRAEEMLVAQAHTLDMVFHQLLYRSVNNIRGGCLEAGETYMRLALRTQSQCRATLETLSVVKNPPSVAFVRQANIANGPQQVNNGTATPQPEAPRAREIPQPQLLEQQSHEWLDTGTAQTAGRGDPAVAPVGKLNGAAHG